MKKVVVAMAAGALVAGCANGPGTGAVVRDEETAIRIGVAECMAGPPPRKELHAKYSAGVWRVWWGGDKSGKTFAIMVNVDAATGAAGNCTVGTS
ncbi:hypothetical protein [Rhizomicrobium electricum]|uniref:Lipoprotein n=1 Tax=Rhizomicrobium electricum TaxID=480070 RepID=A0ABP3Q6U0_9PROT|nr:hypothetical protein [Rhizomicrobium electricum]NIJ50371.1 hypothetical protein [Rhizomicrobium electricum]